MSDIEDRAGGIGEALRLVVAASPRLTRLCYWAGTAAVAAEETGHRRSFDLDFHTREALADVRPILAELARAFTGRIEVVQPPDELGSGFRVVLSLPGGEKMPVEVRSNYEDVPADDLVPSTLAPGLRRVSLARYLADKVQCVAERAEARDLVDILAVVRARPDLEPAARRALRAQDPLIVSERLLSWTPESVAADLAAYDDVSPADALEARALLLRWLREDAT
jgi:hypothetical protein